MKRIAVMGAGTIGTRHIGLVGESPDCELAAIVETRELGGEQAAEVFPTLDEMLRKETPDGVIVATPTDLHEEHALACIGRGLPVLIEKPVAADLESAGRIAEAVERSGVEALVGHVRRHSPVIRAAKEAIDGGQIGEPVSMAALWCLPKPPEYFDKPWRRGAGGGPVLTNLSHEIDVMRHLMGEVAEVRSMLSPSRRGHDGEDGAAVMMRFASGALGTITGSDTAAGPWSWEFSFPDRTSYDHTKAGQDCYMVCGTEGGLGLPSLRLWRHEGRPSWLEPLRCEELAAGGGSAMEFQLEHFLDVIEGEAKPLSSVADAARTLEVTLQVAAGGK